MCRQNLGCMGRLKRLPYMHSTDGWDEKFQSTEEKQCADRILDAWDDSNVCPICIQQMETGHKCEEEDAPIYDQMAYVRQAIKRSLLLKQIKRAHERQASAVDKTAPITMGEDFFSDSEGQHSSEEESHNPSDENNFDDKEDYFYTDSTHYSEAPGAESDRTPSRKMKMIRTPTATIQDCD
jgi:hypothetical protein